MSDLNIILPGEEVISDVPQNKADGSEQALPSAIELLGEEDRAEVEEYLLTEVSRVFDALSERRKSMDIWRRQREVKPEFKRKSEPFDGAANSVPPISAMETATVYGNLQSTFEMRNPPWTVGNVSLEKEVASWAAITEKYINMLADSPTDLNFKKFKQTILYESGSLGNIVGKIAWVNDRWAFPTIDGGAENVVEFVKDYGTKLIPINPDDLLYPPEWDSLQKMPWFGYKYSLPGYEVKRRKVGGYYDYGDSDDGEEFKFGDTGSTTATEGQLNEATRQGVNLSPEKDSYDFYELYVYWSNPNFNGVVTDYIVTIDLAENKIVKVQYNTFGYRPFINFPYLLIPHRFEGIGVGHLTESMQEVGTSVFNMVLDNANYTINKTFVAKVNAGLGGTIKMQPGKVIPVEGETSDIAPLNAGGVDPIGFNIVGMAQNFVHQATGMSETMAGMADSTLKSRDTFAGASMRLQQGKGMFAAVVDNLVDCFGQLGMFVFINLVLHKTEVIEYEQKLQRMSTEDITLLEQALNMDVKDIPTKLKFSIKTTALDQTEEVKRQNYAMLMSMMWQYYGQLTPVYAQLVSPQAPPQLKDFLMTIVIGSTTMMEKILNSILGTEAGNVLPDYTMFEYLKQINANAQAAMMGQMQAAQAAGAMQQNGGLGDLQGIGAAGAQGSPGGSGVGGQPVNGVPAEGGGSENLAGM
jgi:hypothetical protein